MYLRVVPIPSLLSSSAIAVTDYMHLLSEPSNLTRSHPSVSRGSPPLAGEKAAVSALRDGRPAAMSVTSVVVAVHFRQALLRP